MKEREDMMMISLPSISPPVAYFVNVMPGDSPIAKIFRWTEYENITKKPLAE